MQGDLEDLKTKPREDHNFNEGDLVEYQGKRMYVRFASGYLYDSDQEMWRATYTLINTTKKGKPDMRQYNSSYSWIDHITNDQLMPWKT